MRAAPDMLLAIVVAIAIIDAAALVAVLTWMVLR
jgi:hypothetical protein